MEIRDSYWSVYIPIGREVTNWGTFESSLRQEKKKKISDLLLMK